MFAPQLYEQLVLFMNGERMSIMTGVQRKPSQVTGLPDPCAKRILEWSLSSNFSTPSTFDPIIQRKGQSH